jgi:calnexin
LTFDNIYVGHSVSDAKQLAKETWFLKHTHEKELEKQKEPQKTIKQKVTGFLEFIKEQLIAIINETYEFVQIAKKDPAVAIKELPNIAILLVSILVLPMFLIAFFNKNSGLAEVIKDDDETAKDSEDDNSVDSLNAKGKSGGNGKASKKTLNKKGE